jgi:hypothetical protein
LVIKQCRGAPPALLNYKQWHWAFYLALFALSPTLASAQTDASLLFDPWRGKEVVRTQSDFSLFGRERFQEDGSSAAFAESHLTGRWRLENSRDINPSFGFDWTHIEIGGDHRLLPGQLDDASLAFATPIAASGDWFAAALLGFGYAGDNAFGNGRAWNAKAGLIAGRQFKNGDALIFALNYDGNGTLFPDAPLPAVEYSGHLGKGIDFVLGIPIESIEWRISEKLKLSAESYLLTDLDLSIEYQITRHCQVYTRYLSTEYAFAAGGLPPNRRLFFQDQSAEMGLRWYAADPIQIIAAFGYAFGRSFKVGFDDRNLDRLTDLSDEPYFRLGVDLEF